MNLTLGWRLRNNDNLETCKEKNEPTNKQKTNQYIYTFLGNI